MYHKKKGKITQNKDRDERILYERTSHVTQAAKRIEVFLAINFLVHIAGKIELVLVEFDNA